ncbi:MAG: peptidylprolyl isomerase [Halocynthiibacter sp.]
MPTRTAARLVCACLLLISGAFPATAQSLFSPAVKVNDAVVTRYEVAQRIAFLRVLNQPGDIEKQAIEALIDNRLQMQAAKNMGIAIGEEQIAAAMEEFASRAELSTEQFLSEIADAGVAPQTFRNFVNAGLAWREVVGSRFAPRTSITESEIDRALALSSSRGGVRVLLSEIVLPAPPDQISAARARANEISRITTLSAFAAAASSYSAGPTRERGGRVDWLQIGNLPPPVRAQILSLKPGQVTAPIEVNNAILLFQLRAIEETDSPEVETVTVEYASYLIADGPAAATVAQNIRDRVDTCDDLYAVALEQPEEVLERATLAAADIAPEIALELAKLDDNEVSTALRRANGQTMVFLMLCGRITEQEAEVSREDVRAQLTNQRLASHADSYLAELRADATIIYQ